MPDWDAMLTEWDEDTLHISSTGQMMRHQNFGKLILGGEEVTELCIQRFERGDTAIPYFLLLRRICNYDPTPESDRGQVRKMALHWITWYRKHRGTKVLYAPENTDDGEDNEAAAKEV